MSIVHLDTGGRSGGSAGGGDAGDGRPPGEAEFIEALRLRAAGCLERAYRFLETRPDEWALLRAQVLCEARPPADLAARLGDTQAEDGHLPIGSLVSGGAAGFPRVEPEALTPVERGVLGTLEALLVAGDAKVLHAPWVEPAIRYLEAQQGTDGAWRLPARFEGAFAGEAADAGDDPDEAVAIFWTGMIAGICGRSPVSRTGPLTAAGEFLATRFAPERVEHQGYPALLAFSHYFTNVPHDDADEVLQWCGRALEKGFRSRTLDAVATLRVLLTCDAQAMPGASFDVVELLERLMTEQAGDGGFAELSLAGPDARTTQTFDAMLAIVRLCAALDVAPE